MTYYHLRFNVYEPPGAPVEKETWIKFDIPLDGSQIRQHLEREHRNMVSIILCKEINLEEFDQLHSAEA